MAASRRTVLSIVLYRLICKRFFLLNDCLKNGTNGNRLELRQESMVDDATLPSRFPIVFYKLICLHVIWHCGLKSKLFHALDDSLRFVSLDFRVVSSRPLP